MKRILVFAVCLTLTHICLQAQTVKYGIKLGISTPEIKRASSTSISTDSLLLEIQDAGYGFHGGGWVRLKFGGFMFQPEILFNSSKTTYDAKALKGAAILDTLKSESFKNLDFPLLLGFKVSSLRLNAGPVGHYHLSSTSELGELKSYSEKYKSLTWGYQAGLGLDFGRLGIDIRYEGNFDKYGEHIMIGGKSFNFSKKPTRLLVSMAIAF
jgi:Outer membrane protein beta-barrel domain